MRAWLWPLLYVWAAPASLLGLAPLPIVWLQGGRARIVRGTIEIHGGVVSRWLKVGLPWIGGGPAMAMTLGHVIWGCDELCLARCRDHEQVHVRQYERWGPLFIPAYLIASLVAHRRGLDPYFDNPFEREAFEQTERPEGNAEHGTGP